MCQIIEMSLFHWSRMFKYEQKPNKIKKEEKVRRKTPVGLTYNIFCLQLWMAFQMPLIILSAIYSAF